MNHLRIYDRAGRVLRELLNIDHVEVWRSGALHVVMADANEEGRLAVVTVSAPVWSLYEEWTGEPPARGTVYAEQLPAHVEVAALDSPEPGDDSPATDPGAELPYPGHEPGYGSAEPRHAAWPPTGDDPDEYPAPVSYVDAVRALVDHAPEPVDEPGPNPGPRVLVRPYVDAFTMLPDAIRLGKAMTIHCSCEEIRCPYIFNPPTDAERAAVIAAQGTGDRPDAAMEPLKRCTREVHTHEPDDHFYLDGAWPFGAAEHHPMCPRHPARYNQPGAVPMPEGLPVPVTAAAVLAAQGMPGTAAALADRTPLQVGVLVAERPCYAVSPEPAPGHPCVGDHDPGESHFARLPGGDLLHW